MKKIPTVFLRDPENHARVIPEVNPECQWVLDGEGVATVKWDGTCTMLDADGRWWARREVKPGKTPPDNWIAVDADEVTGKRVGWEPVEQSPFAKFHSEALTHVYNGSIRGRTYELVGPKINGNPRNTPWHLLIPHGTTELPTFPRTFDEMADALTHQWAIDHMEGVVWWHPDGRRAKLKAKDVIPIDRQRKESD
ncbi:DUF5565 family protein [Gordonia sp. N1V]|uniref:RNA ligase 1 family protein n=1 Tax=Gordonia sp. N1V TaxID=3034163 RepID=UPI0023E197AB|nr:DUF5565 family protein [Gordonia sp. N1V]MDF3280897.1 DUF5565 family protein [Gordonia sp. N1V]